MIGVPMSEPKTPPYHMSASIQKHVTARIHTLLMVNVPPAMSSMVSLLSLAFISVSASTDTSLRKCTPSCPGQR